MHDIRLAMALVAFASIAVFAVSYRLLKSRSKTFLDIMAVIIVMLIGVYMQTVWGQLWIVNWISLSLRRDPLQFFENLQKRDDR